MTLPQAAKWFDEEYARLSTWRGKLKGDADKQVEGQLAVFAEAGALLRQMARTGEDPQHCKAWFPGVR